VTRARWAVATALLVGCQPAAFPRTGDVVEKGELSADVSLTPVAYEPQTVTLTDGRTLRTKAAFFPMVQAGLRGGVGHCEIGGVYAMTRLLAEGRCGLLQPRHGHPVALAFSGAIGVDYGPYFAMHARIGLDFSVDLGPLIPIVGAYLSAGRQLRYAQDPGEHPIEGPLPGSTSLVRSERRLTLPVGLAIPLVRRKDPGRRYSLVLGASPWFSLVSGVCVPDQCGAVGNPPKAWDAEKGVVFSLGFDLR